MSLPDYLKSWKSQVFTSSAQLEDAGTVHIEATYALFTIGDHKMGVISKRSSRLGDTNM